MRAFPDELWHKGTSSFRLKTKGNQDFSELLLTHPESNSPQAIQGMWQGYGQMRAARILGRSTIVATGLIGVGLWRYQQELKKEKKILEERTIEVESLKASLDKEKKIVDDRTKMLDSRTKQLEQALDAEYLSTLQEEVITRLVSEKHLKEDIRKDLDALLNNPEDKNSNEHLILIESYKNLPATQKFFQTFEVELRAHDSDNDTVSTQPPAATF